MVFSFKYKPVKLKSGNTIYRPMIPLSIGTDEKMDILAVPIDKENVPIIVGRAGFFEQFKITFFEAEKRIDFKKIAYYKLD